MTKHVKGTIEKRFNRKKKKELEIQIFRLWQQVSTRAGYGYYCTEAPPFVLGHAHLGGVQLRPACVILYIQNALLLEPEQPINVTYKG